MTLVEVRQCVLSSSLIVLRDDRAAGAEETTRCPSTWPVCSGAKSEAARESALNREASPATAAIAA